MNIKTLNDIVIKIAFLMLTHGAEIHRIEDTVSRIAVAYGAKADVFAIPSSIVITVSDKNGRTFTQTKRIYSHSTHFDKVYELNALARYICKNKPDANDVMTSINDITLIKTYSLKEQLLASALTSFAFALLFNGGFKEAIIALIGGVIVRFVGSKMESSGGGQVINLIVGGSLCSLNSIIFSYIIPNLDKDIVIISTLMLLVPGLAMTSSMRDLIAGDMVTGVIKATEALLIASSIAVGVMSTIALMRII